jgi:hypothetical protein
MSSPELKQHNQAVDLPVARHDLNCNETVMSGRISISFFVITAISSAFDRVQCDLMASFLVRNWCGCPFRSADARSPLAAEL